MQPIFPFFDSFPPSKSHQVRKASMRRPQFTQPSLYFSPSYDHSHHLLLFSFLPCLSLHQRRSSSKCGGPLPKPRGRALISSPIILLLYPSNARIQQKESSKIDHKKIRKKERREKVKKYRDPIP